MKLTKEEAAAVAALRRLSRRWPKSLWLFSAEGVLHVMKLGDDGKRHQGPDGFMARESSVDQISIPNDGGEW